jgi:hypothetical protein
MDIDLGAGIALSRLKASGKIAGHLGDDQVLLVCEEGSIHAIGATCIPGTMPVSISIPVPCCGRRR